jgi:ribosomal protein S1
MQFVLINRVMPQDDTMNAYEVLLKIHRIGSQISGTVTAREESNIVLGFVAGHARLQTEATYPALLPYSHLVDEPSSFAPNIVPEVGTRVDAVVFNFVDGTLYLSVRPKDLLEATIRKWREYYDYIESLAIGSTIKGRVEGVKPFGLFVNIGGPFIGLIDIGHLRFNGGIQLPCDQADWPKKGDEIQCTIGYFRLHNQQIGLGWLPGNGA